MIFSDMCMYTIVPMKMPYLKLQIEYLPLAMAGKIPDFPSLFIKLYCMKSQIRHHYLQILE